MIRGVSILALLVAATFVVVACGGKSRPNATATSLAAGSTAQGTASSTSGGFSSAAGGTPASSSATQAPGAGAPGAGTAAAGVNGTPGTTSGTPAYTFSTPANTPPPGSIPAPGTTPATQAPVPTGPAGGAIAVAGTSLVAGNVEVTVDTTGTGLPPYMAFNIHLRWNPAIFKFDSAQSTGTILAGSVLCPAAQPDADHGGVVFACTATGNSDVTSAGLLATIVLTPVGTGCSPLHLFTYGGTDGGDDSTGTYTMNHATNIALTVTADGSADQAGQHC